MSPYMTPPISDGEDYREYENRHKEKVSRAMKNGIQVLKDLRQLTGMDGNFMQTLGVK